MFVSKPYCSFEFELYNLSAHVLGARVLLACRDLAKAENTAKEIRHSTGNTDVVIYKLDLASLASVRQCASDVITKEPRLDVLINNAGNIMMTLLSSVVFWNKTFLVLD